MRRAKAAGVVAIGRGRFGPKLSLVEGSGTGASAQNLTYAEQTEEEAIWAQMSRGMQGTVLVKELRVEREVGCGGLILTVRPSQPITRW